jgi:hypothetical protein
LHCVASETPLHRQPLIQHLGVGDYRQAFLCAFRHFAQRAFWAATILLRAAGDIVRPLRPTIETTFCPLLLAHRARWAAAMRARPAAEIVLLVRWLLVPISTESA